MFLALIKGADESDGAFPITPAASGPNAPAQGDMVAIRNAVPKPPEQGGVAGKFSWTYFQSDHKYMQ
ncbi:hypothetical protein X798_02041 [Onchocerca flexuosa]|uniref:Uncharacterized protein n=1 Tax=Onchocerca flexuosa TaxID=387005 RepID=A0A238C079_9BILA|nr:hypothetical protein X798_02041 [Onchocerca flexuosa]